MDSDFCSVAPHHLTHVSALRQNINGVIRGKGEVVDRLLVCLLVGGHVLLEDLPGLGKTTLAYCLARSIDYSFNRIQFTSDLLPSDVLGVSIFDESSRQFVYQAGPVFCNILLADEINRSSPKTQSSLLEVMDRGKVSVDGVTYELPDPFMVIATQNPVDFEGTFPLPDSQMDRFLMRLQMGYPSLEDEKFILQGDVLHYDRMDMAAVISKEDLSALQQAVAEVYVEESVLDYVLRLVERTRDNTFGFRCGISTRGAQSLLLASRGHAFLQGRAFVVPEDVKRVLPDVFVHRLSVTDSRGDILSEREEILAVLNGLIEAVRVPL